MKWLIFALAVLAVIPAAKFFARRPQHLPKLVFLVGFLPFIGLDDVDINLISFETYRGDTRGLEVTLLDLVVWVLALVLPRHGSPYRGPRWLYFGALALSIYGAPMPLFGVFALCKLLRFFIVVDVAARAAERFAPQLLSGMGAGVIFELILSLKQRYWLGMMRAEGNLAHPNTLGMMVNLVAPIAFAIVLAGRGGKLAKATVGAAGLCVVLGLSRGSLAMYVLALTIVFVGSSAQRMTAKKLKVAAAGLAIALVVLIKAWSSLVSRFLHAPRESELARVLFNDAAKAMLHDHPFGVGINQYSYVLSHLGYADRLGIPALDRDGIAHHIYWLTAAETGYVGAIAFAILMMAPMILAVVGARRHKGTIRADVLIGCFAGLAAMSIQGTAEWIARQSPMSYLFWIVAGIVWTLAKERQPSARGHAAIA
jgi:hypothetical protein